MKASDLIVAAALGLVILMGNHACAVTPYPQQVRINDDRIMDLRGDYTITRAATSVEITVTTHTRRRLQAQVVIRDNASSEILALFAKRVRTKLIDGLPQLAIRGRDSIPAVGRVKLKLTGTYDRAADHFIVNSDLSIRRSGGTTVESFQAVMTPPNSERGAVFNFVDFGTFSVLTPRENHLVDYDFDYTRNTFRLNTGNGHISIRRIDGTYEVFVMSTQATGARADHGYGYNSSVSECSVNTEFGVISVEPTSTDVVLNGF